MIILIDIGNSRTKIVQLVSGEMSKTIQLANEDFNLSYFMLNFSEATRIVVANVAAPSLTSTLSSWCTSNNISFKEVYSEAKKLRLTSAYQEPKKLGIDRWLVLLAATDLFPQKNVLIIDAGTATTVDLLDHNGQHQGGWILAGIKTLYNSILSNSTLVHADNMTQPNLAFGVNTTDNVNNACWAATFGMVQQAIIQAKSLGDIEQIILTGGNGHILTEFLSKQLLSEQQSFEKTSTEQLPNIQYIDNLIFYGLRAYTK